MNISVAKSLYMVYLGITFASIYLLYPLFYPPNTLMQLFSSIVILAKCSRMQKLHPTDFKTRGFRLSESVKKNYAPQISRFGPKLSLGHRTMNVINSLGCLHEIWQKHSLEFLEGSNFLCLLHSSRPNISTPESFPRGLVGAGLSTCCTSRVTP